MVDDLKNRLALYKNAEARILTEGQEVQDEDDRKRREASLKEVRAEIRLIQGQINQLTSARRPRTRQYEVVA